MNSDFIAVGALMLVLVTTPFFYIYKWIKEYHISRTNERDRLRNIPIYKDIYMDALAGDDKAEALRAGRVYYGAVRNGALTIYDEQALTNDLSAMK